MSDAAIKVEHISKMYKLYDKPMDRLKESLGLTRKKYYQEHYALNDVSFSVKKGETVGIIGTNGSGKSTILKIITGVLNATSGNVVVDGRISALLELGAGFNMEYTGIENIYLNGTMIGFTKEEIDKKVDAIVEFADIGEFINQPVKTYSSGMFVRLAFAVAINIEPEILIVDEALSVGDVFFQSKCYRKFEEFKEAGKTILFVSHDLGSIAKYCERVYLLNQGVLLAEGPAREVVDIYKKLLVNQLNQSNDTANNSQNKKTKKWCQSIEMNPNKIEYGCERAKIIDFGLFDSKGNITSTLMKGEEFSIKMKIEFFDTIKDPIYAFTIKDIKGTDVTGTNTMLECIPTGIKHAGNIVEVEFSQMMNLQGVVYLLSLGCTGYEDGEFKVYHRLYDICSINVIAKKNSVGFYDMDSIVHVR